MLVLFIAIPAILLALLGNSKVQNFAVDELTRVLSEKLNTEVHIGDVEYKLFNTFRFSDLYVEDLQGDTLVYTDKLDANFQFWKFFKKEFVFRTIELDGFYGNMHIDSAGVNNIDFLIEAFKNPDKKKEKPTLVFQFRDVKLKNSSFKFKIDYDEFARDDKRFDGRNFHFKGIDADLSVDHWQGDSLVASIKSLKTYEDSGLQVDYLHTGVIGFAHGFSFPEFEVKMPHSRVKIDSLKLEYDSIADMKDFLNRVRIRGDIQSSKVTLSDLTALVPNFARLNDPVYVEADINGYVSSFQAKNIAIDYRNGFLFRADVDINGLPEVESTFLYTDVSDLRVNRAELQDFISKISNKPFTLPAIVARLGNMKWQGNITGFFSNLVSYGNLATEVGTLRTDILIQLENKMRDVVYSGSVQSPNFNLGRLLANNTFGKTAFKISTDGSKRYKKPLKGTAHGVVDEIYLNKYSYRNIDVDGDYDSNGFEGDMLIGDPNFGAAFSGMVDLSGKLPVLNFDFQVDSVDLNALKLIDRYEGAKLSFAANTNLIGNSLDNLNGFLLFDNIRFVNKDKELNLELLLLESTMNDHSEFSVTSDILKANFEGNFKYSTLYSSFNQIVQHYLPAFSGENVLRRQQIANLNNSIDFDITVVNTELLSEVMELPFTIPEKTRLKGRMDDVEGVVSLQGMSPELVLGKNHFENLIIDIDNVGGQLNLNLNSSYILPNDQIDFSFVTTALSDSILSNLAWQNNDTTLFAGELQVQTIIQKQNNLSSAEINVLPTEIALADAVWAVRPSRILLRPDSTIDIQNFALQNQLQYILVDGLVSKNRDDVLNVAMQDVDIGYFLNLLRFNAISIKGSTSGSVGISGLLKTPVFESSLKLRDALLNNTPVGDATIYTGWSPGDSELLISGTFVEGDESITLANGSYAFESDSLNFIFDAKRLNIGFLERWLGSIAQDITGRATGVLRMSGTSKNIGFEGNIYAENAAMSVEFLQTRYQFSDSIYLKPKSIEMKNITVRDSENNKGVLNGIFKHDGSFQDINYDLKIRATNMLALNTTVKDNDLFYGKAYATGDVRIHGTDEAVNIDVNVASQPKTKVYISAGGASVASENDFITFINTSDSLASDSVIRPRMESSTKMNLSMNLDVTPEAEIQLIISPQAGDMISANGEGNLRLLLNDDDLRMYGNYTIERGNYLFTLENILRKQFKIDAGSSVSWSGDPLNAQLDIKALHSVTASLYDLMSEDILRTTSRTSVPVNAVLYITENMMSPNIRFDVELPSSDETLKMQVKNLINTEEMMNRQMVYLLIFGKFYTPEYNRNSTGMTASSFNNFSSLASSAALGQFNNYLSQLIENVTFGVNVRSTGYGETMAQEYETAINFQPNNRLIVNGNFGYRDDNFAKNKIIGDVDIEYLLSEKSRWRLKAYNHTIDRYSMKSALFIQGVGIMYKQDFNSWNELFQKFKRTPKPIEEVTDSAAAQANNSSIQKLPPVEISPILRPDTLPFIIFTEARK